MDRLIVEKKHNFDDATTPERHGHIVYCVKNADGESDGLPECEGVEEFNDGLDPDEMKSSPFETKDGGYAEVNSLSKNGFITDEDAEKLYRDIDKSDLL